jgi:Rrf2 family protein
VLRQEVIDEVITACPRAMLAEIGDLLDEARGHHILVEARPGHGSERLSHLLGGRTPHRSDLPCEAPWAIPEDTADQPPTLTDQPNVDKYSQGRQSRCQGGDGVVKVTLGKKGDYSVRAILDLAMYYRGGRRKAQEIATSMRIPEKFLAQILADLVRSGLIAATAGPDGGYELRRPPSQIRLLDVVEAAEGQIELQECVLRGIPCGGSDTCAVHEVWSEAQEAMSRRLRRTTFAQIVRRESASPLPGSRGSKRSH